MTYSHATLTTDALLGLVCLCAMLPALLLVACAALSARVERLRDRIDELDGDNDGG